MVKAKIDFLWYNAGEEIKDSDKDNISGWEKDGLVESGKKEEESFAEKVADVVEDVLDDGKLNKSHKKKKSKKSKK